MRISDWSSDVCSSDLMRVEADANLDKALHLKTQREGIEARRIALNDTPFLEAPDPRPARRFGEPDRFAQLRKGLASVLFQRGNDFPVESVHILRSEEHTSELQSLMRISYAVFCLKKKTANCEDNTKYIQLIHKL